MYLCFAYIYKPSTSNLPVESISIKLNEGLIDNTNNNDYSESQNLLKNSINNNKDTS